MPKKVFEVANEIGMRPLDLVEKLKEQGFDIRNHMSTLSDDDLAKVMADLAPAEDDSEDKSAKAKKKVVKKKKVVNKKVTTVKPQDQLDAASDDDGDDAGSGKKVIRRKASVIRKSLQDQDGDMDEDNGDRLDDFVESNDSETNQLYEETGIVRELQIVSEPSDSEDDDVVEDDEDSEVSEEEVIFKEKMHTFTPIYIPEEKEEEEVEEAQDEASSESSNLRKKASPDRNFVDEKDDVASKKKLGGLAAMMGTKGKAGSLKKTDLSDARSEEELKTYVMGAMGRGYYVPAKRKKIFVGHGQKTEVTEVKESKRVLGIHDSCSLEELAQKLSVKFDKLAASCLELNLLVRPTDYVGLKLASEIANLYNYRVENRAFNEEEILKKEDVDKSSIPLRTPIITVMGHVDHGKTSLLDYIRKAKVASGEAGGITQHIGAYSVEVSGSLITFLDTPGHAAFASMRQRGADVTDLVVLVVAADDGVMPQTKESIRFCQNAGVPIVVAINKMDKEGANPERIKQELTEFSLVPEEWGGDTQFCPVSAHTGEGIDSLLEGIKVQTEMMELRADPKGPAEGVVIESKVEKGRGTVATILVQKGTLSQGDSLVAGETLGRARSLMDFSGKLLKKAGPSTPVQIIGLETPPLPGDIVNVLKNEREAKKVVDNRITKRKELEAISSTQVNSLEDFFASAPAEEQKVLKLIVRADVQGSFEAIKQAIEALGNNEVKVEVIGGGVGAINDNDVLHASSVGGYIFGFNMRPITSARALAEQKGVQIKNYSIIYELIQDITLALEGMLSPESVEVYVGRAEVRDVFNIPKIGAIAGSAVIDGKIQKGCSVRLLRDGKIIFDGKLSSLKRFKDDVKEVASGYECGIALENFNDIKVADIFEAYIMEEKARKLEHELIQ